MMDVCSTFFDFKRIFELRNLKSGSFGNTASMIENSRHGFIESVHAK